MLRKILTALVGVSLSAAIGCANNYDSDADLYRTALSEREPATTTTDPAAPLKLSDAILLTNRHNELLAVEGENFVQSLVAKQRAAAEFLPTISFSPGYTRRDRFYESDNAGAHPTRDSTELDTGLEWNLFRGYRDVANLYSAASTIDERRAILNDLQSTILLQTVDAFYATLSAERAIAVLTSSLRVQDERVREMRGRQKAGVARPLDVSQTEAQASAARVQLITAQNNAKNSRTALQLLIQQPVGTRALVDDFTPPAELPDVSDWQSLATQHRQDRKASEAALDAAKHAVDAAFGQYYPTVTLNLDALLTIENAATEVGWVGTLRANVPIFTAGRIEADVRNAWSRVRQAKLTNEYIKRLIASDIDTAYANMSATRDRVTELRLQLRATQDAFEQADKSYNVGLATNLERLIAQDRLLATELQLTTEELSLRRARLALSRAAGDMNPSTLTAPATQPAPTTRPATP